MLLREIGSERKVDLDITRGDADELGSNSRHETLRRETLADCNVEGRVCWSKH
jgi:hypothetical protein